MSSWFIGEIDWPARNATSGGVKRRVWMRCLKHVPVGQDVKVLGEQGIVRVAKHVPRMGSGNFREKVWIYVRLVQEVKEWGQIGIPSEFLTMRRGLVVGICE